jgi:hypothetical protein
MLKIGKITANINAPFLTLEGAFIFAQKIRKKDRSIH